MMHIQVQIDPANRRQDGLAAFSFQEPGSGQQRQLDIGFKNLYGHCGIPDPIAFDFLTVASLIYAVDKTLARSSAPDNWTREIELNLPVSNPELWENAAKELEACLTFLSGDIWQLTFYELPGALFRRPVRRRITQSYRRQILARRNADTVCLFSGGLDSLIGAVNLLSSEIAEHLLLVGHYDAPGPASTQNGLFDTLKFVFPRRTDLLQVRVSHKPEAANESSQRTRSIVFLALGLYAARTFGPDVALYAPENGLIAINIPLTPSRSGSCSTRTMHPFFLEKVRSALSSLGILNPIINPFELKTKGECVVECLNPRQLHTLQNYSVSCAHASRRQEWARKGANNCGYCVPCIFRRAALHQAGLDNGHQYGIDFCSGELSADDPVESANDLRAIIDFVRKQKNTDELAKDILRVAPVDRVVERAEMASRGFEEIRSLIRDKGNPALRRATGVLRNQG